MKVKAVYNTWESIIITLVPSIKQTSQTNFKTNPTVSQIIKGTPQTNESWACGPKLKLDNLPILGVVVLCFIQRQMLLIL